LKVFKEVFHASFINKTLYIYIVCSLSFIYFYLCVCVCVYNYYKKKHIYPTYVRRKCPETLLFDETCIPGCMAVTSQGMALFPVQESII